MNRGFMIGLLAVAVHVPEAAAQFTTAVALDADHVYQGTPYGLVVRRRADPSQIVTRYVRNQPLVDALKASKSCDNANRRVDERLLIPKAGNDVLAENMVVALALDPEGRLWVASRCGGLVRRDHDGRFFRIPPEKNSPISAMAVHAGNVWVVHDDDGPARYDGKTWQAFETSSTTVDVALTPKGHLFFTLYGGGVAHVEGGQLREQSVCSEQSVCKSPGGNRLTTTMIDRKGVLWGVFARGLLRYDGGHSVSISEGIAGLEITALAESVHRGLLVGTERGLFTVRDQGVVPLPYGLGQGMAVNCIVPDGDQIWVGTAQGLVRLSGSGRELFVEPSPWPLAPGDNVEMQCSFANVGCTTDSGELIRLQRRDGECIAGVPQVWGEDWPLRPWRIDCAVFDRLVRRLQPERWRELDPRTLLDHCGYSERLVVLTFQRRDPNGNWNHDGGNTTFRGIPMVPEQAMCNALVHELRASVPEPAEQKDRVVPNADQLDTAR